MDIADLFNYHADYLHAFFSKRLVQIVSMSILATPRTDIEGIARHKGIPSVNTGFLIEIENEWFVATAGHVIEKIKELPNEGRSLQSITAFVGMGPSQAGTEVRLEAKRLAFGYDEKRAIDVGLISIEEEERTAIAQAGGEAFLPVECQTPNFEPNLYLTTGFPHHATDPQYSISEDKQTQHLVVKANWPLIPLWPIRDGRSDTDMLPHFRSIQVGRSDAIPFTSANGMSGGPILAIQLGTNAFRFSVLAMQTFENKQGNDIVLGGPFLRQLRSLHRMRNNESE